MPTNSSKTESQQRREAQYRKACDIAIDFAGSELPNFGNMTPQGLVDQIGVVDRCLKDMEKAKETLKNILRSKYDDFPDEVRGEAYICENRKSTREALNQGKAKEVLASLDRLQECMSTSEVSALYFKEL